MKKNLLYSFLFALLIASMGFIHQENPKDSPIHFNRYIYNFDTLLKGQTASTYFTCINNSDTTLIIENIETSCGCMVPKYQQEPIQPHDSTIIKIKFDSSRKRSGNYFSIIGVYTNQGLFELAIKAYIKAE
jgi:hypothetical protein